MAQDIDGKQKLMDKSSRFIKLSLLVFCYLFFMAGPSSALFGSECKKPKTTYSKYLKEYNKQLKAEKSLLARYQARKESEYKECLKNPKQYLASIGLNWGPKGKSGCLYLKSVQIGESESISGRKSVEAYRDAMLIIKNYKNCFKPSQYINATQWLKNNNK